MALSPEKLAEIVARAKVTAAKEVEDPSAPKAEVPALDRDLLQAPTRPQNPVLVEHSGVPVANVHPQVTQTAQATPAEVSYPGLFELQEKILTLDRAIQSNHPEFDSLLETIHRNLDKDAQLLHLLKPDDIAIIFKGLKKKTQTVIVSETVGSAASGRSRGLKNIGLDDL